MSAGADTAVFDASNLAGNDIGGYYDDEGEFISTTEGVTALWEGLKKSSVTLLTCAATSKHSLYVSGP